MREREHLYTLAAFNVSSSYEIGRKSVSAVFALEAINFFSTSTDGDSGVFSLAY